MATGTSAPPAGGSTGKAIRELFGISENFVKNSWDKIEPAVRRAWQFLVLTLLVLLLLRFFANFTATIIVAFIPIVILVVLMAIRFDPVIAAVVMVAPQILGFYIAGAVTIAILPLSSNPGLGVALIFCLLGTLLLTGAEGGRTKSMLSLLQLVTFVLVVLLLKSAVTDYMEKNETEPSSDYPARGGVTPAPGMPAITLEFVRKGQKTVTVPAGTSDAPGISGPYHIPIDKETQRVARYFWFDTRGRELLTDREYESIPPQTNIPSWKGSLELTGGKERNVRSILFKNPHPEEAKVDLFWRFY